MSGRLNIIIMINLLVNVCGNWLVMIVNCPFASFKEQMCKGWKTIEKVIRLSTVLIFFLSDSFEDIGKSSRIYLYICYGSI